jgi:hypothetical protein
MTVWWERARSPAQSPVIERGQPRIVPGGRSRLLADLKRRAATFVPEWRPADTDDAGSALVKLFGVQLEPVLSRLEQLDERSLIEFLSIAGLGLAPARPASSLVSLTAATAAPASVIVPQGFPLSSQAADDKPGDVTWETERAVAVLPGELAEIFVFDGELLRPVVAGEPFAPFGPEQKPGSYVLLGLESRIAPSPTLSLGFVMTGANELPAPVAVGGEAAASLAQPVLRWEALSEGRFAAVEVIVDDSGGLSRTGATELRMPRAFGTDRPAAAGAGKPRRWLRLRLLQGRHLTAPTVARILLNVVSVLSARTLRDELPVPVGASAPGAWRLSQKPVLPGSLILEVDEGALESELDEDEDSSASEASPRRWREVETLIAQPPDARVFTLDAATATITFGNDVEGRKPPAGTRNVIARSYRIASGRSAAVEAGAITKLVRSLPHLKGVANPLPASGGADAETLEHAQQDGPALVSARGRAVSPGEMARFAGQAKGADVARAFALRGVDPALPGARLPGVVGLFIVPQRRPKDPSAGPPVPDQATLQAAAAHVALSMGPLGARVVAAAPRYHSVRIEASIELDRAADAAATMRVLLDSLDAYLSPYAGGGEDGRGWPLGEPIRHALLVRRLLTSSAAVRSVPYLAILLDEVRQMGCADAVLTAYGLPWPGQHELLPLPSEARA